MGKKVRSHLAIGKKPLPDGKHELFIMVTNAQNKQVNKKQFITKKDLKHYFYVRSTYVKCYMLDS